MKNAIKEIRYFLLLAGVLIVFMDFVNQLFIDFFVNKIFGNANNNIAVDIIFIGISLFLIYSFWQKVKVRYYINPSQVILSIIALGFYIYYRYVYQNLFLSFSFLNQIMYFDVIAIYFVSPVVLKLVELVRTQDNVGISESTLYSDRPILLNEQDKLERSYKAERAFNEIKNIKIDCSVSYGITGEWGTGKTSFINLIKEKFIEAKDSSYVIIDFNPWLNISASSIIQDFFDTLEENLKNHNYDIAKDIKKYAGKVLNLHKNSLTETLLNASNLVFGSNLTDGFKEINIRLKKLNKRVVIFIDDFDRLQPNEIFETLKLIRNTAGFDSFTYIVAYDKEYVTSSLQNLGIPKASIFSEKIFLFETELLPVTNAQVNNSLMEELVRCFPMKEKEIRSFFDSELPRFFNSIDSVRNVTSGIKHFRDLKRFLNSFITDYNIIKDEVLFRDYFVLKLLKFKYYPVYSLLFNSKDDFIYFKKDGSYPNNPKYVYRRVDPNKEYGTDYYDVFGGSLLEVYLKENFRYESLEMKEISNLLNNLLMNDVTTQNSLSIGYDVNYYKYFKDNLGIKELSVQEFKNEMSKSTQEIEVAILNWYSLGKIEHAKYYLCNIKYWELNSRKEYESYLHAIFFLARLKRTDIIGYSNVIGYPFESLYSAVENRKNEIVEKFYSSDQELKTFIKSILWSAPAPYEFESAFCNYLVEFSDLSGIINMEDVHNYLIHYFKQHEESATKLDRQFYNLFHRCEITKYQQTSPNVYQSSKSYLPEAKEIFKNFIYKDLDEILVTFIAPGGFYGQTLADKSIGLSNITEKIFDEFSDFLEFIRILNASNIESEFLAEFTNFVEELNSFNNQIEFSFTYPPVLEKLLKQKLWNSRE